MTDHPIDHKRVQQWLDDLIKNDPMLKRIQQKKNDQIQARVTQLKKKVWDRWDKHRSRLFRENAAKLGAPVQPQELERTRRFG